MTILTSTWIWSFFLFLALDRSEKNSMCYLYVCARARQKFDMAENESIQFAGKKIKKLNFYLDFAFFYANSLALILCSLQDLCVFHFFRMREKKRCF